MLFLSALQVVYFLKKGNVLIEVLIQRKLGDLYKLNSLTVIGKLFFSFPGDYSEEVTPVPIPNTEVKLFSADDTALVWESRSSPGI